MANVAQGQIFFQSGFLQCGRFELRVDLESDCTFYMHFCELKVNTSLKLSQFKLWFTHILSVCFQRGPGQHMAACLRLCTPKLHKSQRWLLFWMESHSLGNGQQSLWLLSLRPCFAAHKHMLTMVLAIFSPTVTVLKCTSVLFRPFLTNKGQCGKLVMSWINIWLFGKLKLSPLTWFISGSFHVCGENIFF